MRTVLREPLVHFLALGAVLFGIGLLRGDTVEPTANRIAITSGVVEHLTEEVLYREALAMGLDRDDQIIRRRLRQKLEFLTADVMESFEPTDDELQAYLDADRDRYRQEAVLGFTQVYLRAEPDAERPAAGPARAATAPRASARVAGAAGSRVGVPTRSGV